jgi:hypothetical protein
MAARMKNPLVKISKKNNIERTPEGVFARLDPEDARVKGNIGYKGWMLRAKRHRNENQIAEALACEALAYTSEDGFLPFCREILGYRELEDDFHGKMMPYVTGYMRTDEEDEFPIGKKEFTPYRMLMAFRGSFKSSLSSMAFPTWRIAQDTVSNQWEYCNIRIAIASERLPLAKQFVRTVRAAISSHEFEARFGKHKPTGRVEGSWGTEMLTSRLQNSLSVKDPTVFTIALGAERTGFHCNTVVADDLQAFASSFSRDQLDKCWELYTLLHSILDPGSDDTLREMLICGTRWHYDDIYARIEESAKNAEKETPHFRIKYLPAEYETILDDGKGTRARKAAFQSRFPLKTLDEIRSHQGRQVYAAQYLLNPVPESDRVFLRRDMRYRDTIIDENIKSKSTYTVIGADPAWISDEKVRLGEGQTDNYSAVAVLTVDAGMNIYIMDIWREQCSVKEFTDRIWEMYDLYNAIRVGVQQFDFRYLFTEFERKRVETRLFPVIDWVSSARGSGNKDDRIKGKLAGLWQAHKIFLPRGVNFLEQEFLDFPKSKYKDCLDAICNGVQVMTLPVDRKIVVVKDHATRIIDDIESGKTHRKKDGDWGNAY